MKKTTRDSMKSRVPVLDPKLSPVQASRRRYTQTKRFEVRICTDPGAIRDLKKAAQSINRLYGVDEI